MELFSQKNLIINLSLTLYIAPQAHLRGPTLPLGVAAASELVKGARRSRATGSAAEVLVAVDAFLRARFTGGELTAAATHLASAAGQAPTSARHQARVGCREWAA